MKAKEAAEMLKKTAFVCLGNIEKTLKHPDYCENFKKDVAIDWVTALFWGAQGIRLAEELGKENEKLRAALDNDGFRCDGCDIVEKAKEALRGNEKLKQRLAEAERERDAAVAELKFGEDCDNCKHRNECKYDGFGYKKCSECGECPCSKCEGGESQYEWRGVCEANSQ